MKLWWGTVCAERLKWRPLVKNASIIFTAVLGRGLVVKL